MLKGILKVTVETTELNTIVFGFGSCVIIFFFHSVTNFALQVNILYIQNT